MPFVKLTPNRLPPRHWALVGFPGSGKSTFAAQMAGPILAVDADQRFSEVCGLAVGDVYKLSDDPTDNTNAEKIADRLRGGMPGAGVRTIVLDSLTSILSPLVIEAILDNEAGRNKNRVAAFKDKALAMRLLQDTITGWGCDVLWIWHYRQGMDAQAQMRETASISAVELARLRRSLNMQLSVIVDGQRRGVRVDWARRGRAGLILWDESGRWLGMPERIERAVYGGLSPADMDRIATAIPTRFDGIESAIAWGVEQNCFRDAVHARNAYEELKRNLKPQTAQEMWDGWIAEVNERVKNVSRETMPQEAGNHEQTTF